MPVKYFAPKVYHLKVVYQQPAIYPVVFPEPFVSEQTLTLLTLDNLKAQHLRNVIKLNI